MRYLVLVTDYDDTIASDGTVNEPTLSALERLRASGRRLVLLTGRRLDDLLAVCPRLKLFDYVVAENGAITIALKNPQRYRSVSAFAPITGAFQTLTARI